MKNKPIIIPNWLVICAKCKVKSQVNIHFSLPNLFTFTCFNCGTEDTFPVVDGEKTTKKQYNLLKEKEFIEKELLKKKKITN